MQATHSAAFTGQKMLCFREAREGFAGESSHVSEMSDYNGTRIPGLLDLTLSRFSSVNPFPSFLAYLTLIYSENSDKSHSLQETISDFQWLGQAPLLCASITYISLHIGPANTGSFVCLQSLDCRPHERSDHVCFIHHFTDNI